MSVKKINSQKNMCERQFLMYINNKLIMKNKITKIPYGKNVYDNNEINAVIKTLKKSTQMGKIGYKF
jgi:hypothetical protein